MPSSPSHPGYVDDQGELHMEFPFQFDDALTRLKGRRVSVCVKRVALSRTLSQNAHYWACCQEAARQTGNDLNAIHDALKWLHLPHQTISFKGEKIEVPGSTTGLTIEEMSEYIERCKATLTQDGITLPDPES